MINDEFMTGLFIVGCFVALGLIMLTIAGAC